MSKYRIVAGMALSVALIAFSGHSLFAKVVDKTVAIVNGEAIMLSEFDKIASPIIEQYKQAAPETEKTPEKIKELKQKLLDQMVEDKILKQQAQKSKIRITKRELEEGVNQVKKRFANEAEFQSELKKENITTGQFEKRIEEQLMVMKLIEQEIKAKTPQPSEQEVKAYYEKIQAKMAGKDLGLDKKEEDELGALAKYLSKLTSEQVHARHILVAVDKNASKETKAAALKKIQGIQKELKDGADFEDLAQKYSDDPGSKPRGGDLGFFARGDMVPEFEKVAFSLNVGQVSEPVLTDFGYHLIKVEEKRAARKLTYDDVKNDLKELLAQKAAQKRYESWLKDLRAKASVKINPIE
ncbi:MAG: peptidylprolyl isomerase [Endomicrobiales bacterium]